MMLIVRTSRPRIPLPRSCTLAARAVVLAAISGAAGCATAPSSATLIQLRSPEAARWISSETVGDYGCDAGALVCSADGGRLTERKCRCQ
jgi:hypothetical protein